MERPASESLILVRGVWSRSIMDHRGVWHPVRPGAAMPRSVDPRATGDRFPTLRFSAGESVISLIYLVMIIVVGETLPSPWGVVLMVALALIGTAAYGHRAMARLAANVSLRTHRCPVCTDDLNAVAVSGDGCRTCATCEAAWRLPDARALEHTMRRHGLSRRERVLVGILTAIVAFFWLAGVALAIVMAFSSIAISALLAVPLLVLPIPVYRDFRHRLRRRRLLCPECAYDLTDVAAAEDGCRVCSECGGAWRLPDADSATRGEAVP